MNITLKAFISIHKLYEEYNFMASINLPVCLILNC